MPFEYSGTSHLRDYLKEHDHIDLVRMMFISFILQGTDDARADENVERVLRMDFDPAQYESLNKIAEGLKGYIFSTMNNTRSAYADLVWRYRERTK